MSRRKGKARAGGRSRGSPTFGVVAAIVGLGLWYILAESAAWQPYFSWLVAWGVATFGFYAWDKEQARSGGWRVPETVLHGLALVGGVAGAWVGMLALRHKTQHVEFKLVLIVATIIHVAVAQSVLR